MRSSGQSLVSQRAASMSKGVSRGLVIGSTSGLHHLSWRGLYTKVTSVALVAPYTDTYEVPVWGVYRLALI